MFVSDGFSIKKYTKFDMSLNNETVPHQWIEESQFYESASILY